jgi:hypothetical protein
MKDISATISNLKGLVTLKPVSKDMISDSEKQLGLSFAEDYKIYLEKYGVISAQHIEITGITDSPRLNVVHVTLAEREINQIPPNMYVVEDTGIEGILILQNEKGEVFELQNNDQIKKIYNNLSDYLLSCLE